MTLFEALFLATIQGLTEFLPISSSGHLVFFQKLLGFARTPILFDILLHLGTLGSILVFFRKEFLDLILNFQRRLNIWIFIILGSIPAAFLGFLFNAKIESAFNSLTLVGIAWIIFGTLLILTSKLKSRKREMNWQDALFVGVAQALALLPGISRSGSTISAGLVREMPRESAFRFSFLLAIPAILGATVLEVKEAGLLPIFSLTSLLSTLVAGIVGYLALVLLQKTLHSEKFYLFGFYCLAIGLSSLLLGLKF